MLLKTILVEDEPHSRDRLASLLTPHRDVKIIGHAGSGPEAVELINKLAPDLVFLDVQLPGYTGIEVLQHIDHLPMIIFVTAYDEYAIRAFEENAIDYLLKPTTPERLAKALQRARERVLNMNETLIGKLSQSMQAAEYLQRFTIKVGDEILLIPVSDVDWIDASEKYVFIHTGGREYIVNETLKNLETLLSPDRFIRIHKSVIINTEKIRRIKHLYSNTYRVELTTGDKKGFEIGRTFLSNVRQRLNF